MIEYWDKILYLAGIAVAFVTGNKTKKIENKGGELDNLLKYQLMYNNFVSQFEAQFDGLKHKIECLEIDVNNLELRNAIIVEENQHWKKEFSELQKLYDKLKSEFEAYKKKHR